MDINQLRQKGFRNLTRRNTRETSPPDRSYNCIAFAAEVTSDWWEPDPFFQYFWPLGIERRYTVRAYQQAFTSLGYDVCTTPMLEPGFKKVALYTLNNLPQHAARQVDSTWWTSKLGPDVDIEHTFDALDGGPYGNVALLLRKPS